MRIAIAGLGKVGTSIAGELAGNGHTVLAIDKDPTALEGSDTFTAFFFV